MDVSILVAKTPSGFAAPGELSSLVCGVGPSCCVLFGDDCPELAQRLLGSLAECGYRYALRIPDGDSASGVCVLAQIPELDVSAWKGEEGQSAVHVRLALSPTSVLDVIGVAGGPPLEGVLSFASASADAMDSHRPQMIRRPGRPTKSQDHPSPPPVRVTVIATGSDVVDESGLSALSESGFGDAGSIEERETRRGMLYIRPGIRPKSISGIDHGDGDNGIVGVRATFVL